MATPGRNSRAVAASADDRSPATSRAAFRQLVMATHPDRGGDAADFVAVLEAFRGTDRRRAVTPAAPFAPRPTPYDALIQPRPGGRQWGEPRRTAAASIIGPLPTVSFASVLAAAVEELAG